MERQPATEPMTAPVAPPTETHINFFEENHNLRELSATRSSTSAAVS